MAMAAMSIARENAIDKARTSSWPEELEQHLCKQVLVKRHVRDPLLGSSKFTVRYLGSRLTWNMSFAKETETRIAAALCVANVGRFLDCASQRQLKKVQCVQSNCTGCDPLGFVRFCRPEWELYKEWILPVESVPEQIGASTLCNDKEDLGQ